MKFLGLIPLFFLAGCSSFSWLPWLDEKPESEKPSPLVDFNAEAKIVRVWDVRVGKGLGRKYLRLSPVVIADRVYAADAYGMVVAYNRFDGEVLWRTRIDEADPPQIFEFWNRRDPAFVTGGVGSGNGFVLVGTTRGEVISLDAGNGEIAWRRRVSSEVLAPPAADNGLVVVQTSDGKITAFESKDGSTRWSYDTVVPILTLRGTAAPVIAGNLVYAGFATGMVVAVDAQNGQPIWEQRVMLPQGRSELDRIVDVDSTPLVTRNFVFAVSFQGRLKALRGRDGTQIWEREASSFLDLTEGYGQVYVVSDDDVIQAIEQTDASVAWEQTALRNRDLSSPLAFGNYVVVGDAQGYLHVLAQSDGRLLARRKIDRKGLRSRMIVADNTVYLLANGGRLSALEIRRKE